MDDLPAPWVWEGDAAVVRDGYGSLVYRVEVDSDGDLEIRREPPWHVEAPYFTCVPIAVVRAVLARHDARRLADFERWVREAAERARGGERD